MLSRPYDTVQTTEIPMSRHFAPLALALLVLLALPLHAEKVPNLPAPTGYIDDYAAVLTPEAHSQLESLCRDLHAKAQAQLFLVTVHNLGGESKEQFAADLFAKWKIGPKRTNRGVLILLAIDDRQYRIEVGYGFERLLTNAKVGDIGREMVPSLKAADYDNAARIAIDDIAEDIATDAHITLAPPQADPAPTSRLVAPPPVSHTSDILGDIVGIVLFAGFAIFAMVLNTRSRFVPRTFGSSNTFINPSQPTYFETNNSLSNSFIAGDAASSTFVDTSSSTPTDTFTGGDGGASGGAGAGGSW